MFLNAYISATKNIYVNFYAGVIMLNDLNQLDIENYLDFLFFHEVLAFI